MRILIAGCWRSGTTALYNLVRVICEEHGNTYACFEDTYNESIGGEFDFEIVKVHKFKKTWIDWADLVFTIWREPGEVWNSFNRFFKSQDKETTLNDYGRGLTWFGLYNRFADYEVRYKQLNRSTEKLARGLAEQIGFDINEKQIVKRFRQVKPPKEGIDPVTLLHSNHITRK